MSNRRIAWGRIGAEGVAIVASILLALAIEAAWSRSQLRQDEQVVLKALLDDFERSRTELAEVIETIERRDERYGYFLAATPAEIASWSDSTSYIAILAESRTYDARTGTLDGLLGGGTLDIIESIELKSALSGWTKWLEDLTEHAVEMRAEAVRVARLTEPYGGPHARLRRGPYLLLADASTMARMRADEELMGATRTAHYHSVLYLLNLDAGLTELDSVVALIEREIVD